MGNMEQKTGSGTGEKKRPDSGILADNNNLGLDADHSSDQSRYKVNLDNDNDRISHNPDGEDDDHDTTEEPGSSPLMDK